MQFVAPSGRTLAATAWRRWACCSRRWSETGTLARTIIHLLVRQGFFIRTSSGFTTLVIGAEYRDHDAGVHAGRRHAERQSSRLRRHAERRHADGLITLRLSSRWSDLLGQRCCLIVLFLALALVLAIIAAVVRLRRWRLSPRPRPPRHRLRPRLSLSVLVIWPSCFRRLQAVCLPFSSWLPLPQRHQTAAEQITFSAGRAFAGCLPPRVLRCFSACRLARARFRRRLGRGNALYRRFLLGHVLGHVSGYFYLFGCDIDLE